jgi:hypothetical protein
MLARQAVLLLEPPSLLIIECTGFKVHQMDVQILVSHWLDGDRKQVSYLSERSLPFLTFSSRNNYSCIYMNVLHSTEHTRSDDIGQR